MEIREIKRQDAIDKLADFKMDYLLNNLKDFKLFLKCGFDGFDVFDNYTLELLLRDKIDENVKFKII